MSAPPAHHLGTAGLPLDGDQADGTPLDVLAGEESVPVLGTGVPGGPDGLALHTELGGAGRAEDQALLHHGQHYSPHVAQSLETLNG